MKHLWGATIIAVVIYFILSFFSDLWFGVPNQQTIGIALRAGAKALILGVIFHYVHSFVAHMLGWYDYDPELDAPRRKPEPVAEEQE
ncbi:hypothetical protein [Pontivivens insulae]|uniref:Uncharacterized protein n=1 Tax=Pontivivens insulae TaxID=1639689 RepID=A0A2R8AAU6_9RHOB|nr:hypothetical protein [Pontivivens insulae]RED13249.1 hypothetical protein DFR53_2385 [Pontivivens insulae]SPF29341.1 hypothetical protein POI8812_01649 [Pontivivens insulae]